jgi:hypothetical protein
MLVDSLTAMTELAVFTSEHQPRCAAISGKSIAISKCDCGVRAEIETAVRVLAQMSPWKKHYFSPIHGGDGACVKCGKDPIPGDRESCRSEVGDGVWW